MPWAAERCIRPRLSGCQCLSSAPLDALMDRSERSVVIAFEVTDSAPQARCSLRVAHDLAAEVRREDADVEHRG